MSEEQSSIHPIQLNIRIENAKLIGFEITSKAELLKESLPQDKYEYSIIPSFKVANQREIEVIIKVEIKDIDSKDELGSIKTQFFFAIDKLKEIAKFTENTMSVNPAIIVALIGLSISTTRGMLIMCSANSVLANAILPPYDASKLNSSIPSEIK